MDTPYPPRRLGPAPPPAEAIRSHAPRPRQPGPEAGGIWILAVRLLPCQLPELDRARLQCPDTLRGSSDRRAQASLTRAGPGRGGPVWPGKTRGGGAFRCQPVCQAHLPQPRWSTDVPGEPLVQRGSACSRAPRIRGAGRAWGPPTPTPSPRSRERQRRAPESWERELEPRAMAGGAVLCFFVFELGHRDSIFLFWKLRNGLFIYLFFSRPGCDGWWPLLRSKAPFQALGAPVASGLLEAQLMGCWHGAPGATWLAPTSHLPQGPAEPSWALGHPPGPWGQRWRLRHWRDGWPAWRVEMPLVC